MYAARAMAGAQMPAAQRVSSRGQIPYRLRIFVQRCIFKATLRAIRWDEFSANQIQVGFRIMSDTTDSARLAALNYHEFPKPGKLEIRATKPLANGRDLARAYSPGVAEACLEIKADAATASRYTSRGNLVGVVTNGTAVLGLGNIGALASKPVMEGKAVLFKKFAGIDVFDIEIDEIDPKKLIEVIAPPENIWVADKDGLVTHKRNDVNDKWRDRFRRVSDATTLAEVFDGADIF